MIITERIPTGKGHHVTVTGPDQDVANWRWSIRTGNYEKFEMEAIKRSKFSVFLDIGAAFGYYSQTLSRLGKRCVAVEPDPFRWACLNDTTGEFERIQAIVGDEPLTIPALGHLATNRHDGPKMDVSNISIVDLFNSYDDGKTLVKLDIEGGEFDLLEKNAEFLKDSNASLAVEIHEWNGRRETILNLFTGFKSVLLHEGKNKDNVTYLISKK